MAYLLARGQFLGRMALAAFVYLPLVLPPVVTGYALLLLLGRHGPLGAWLDAHLGNRPRLPLDRRRRGVRRDGVPADGAVDPAQLRGGRSRAGACRGDARRRRAAIFLTVTLPLSLPGVLAGALMAFAKSLGEFGATITFVSNIPGETRTLPVAIYGLLQVPGSDAAVLRLAGLSVFVSLVAVIGAELVARRLRRGLDRA